MIPYNYNNFTLGQPIPIIKKKQIHKPTSIIQPKIIQNPTSKKTSKKQSKPIISFFVGLVLGAIIFSTLSFFLISRDCSPLISSAAKTYYSLGATYIMNYTQSTGKLPYFENGELQEKSILSLCEELNKEIKK